MSNQEKRVIANYSLKYLPKKGVVGIGSGSTVNIFLEEIYNKDVDLSELVFVPGSLQTLNKMISFDLNYSVVIPPEGISIVFDGADYWTSKGDLIKGGGGALYREKLLFYNSQQIVVMAGKSKQVPVIGGPDLYVPIEVPFFSLYPLMRFLKESFNAEPVIRTDNRGNPFKTDNNNLIVDTYFKEPIKDPFSLNEILKRRPEVICTGIFSGFKNMLLVTTNHDNSVIERSFT